MTTWVKLKKANDWGVDYWARKPFSDWGAADARRGVSFKNGEPVRVQLKDGTVVQAKIAIGTLHTSVSDHGHRYDIRSPLVEVVFLFHENTVRLSVADVKFERSWVEAREP